MRAKHFHTIVIRTRTRISWPILSIWSRQNGGRICPPIVWGRLMWTNLDVGNPDDDWLVQVLRAVALQH